MDVETHELELAAVLQQMNTTLHDLCQPLTTLQCRLGMAQLLDTPEGHREAVEAGVPETARLASYVHTLRELLQQASTLQKSED